jgi:hypothetical protein
VVKIKYCRVLPSVTFKYHQPKMHESQDVKRKVDEPRKKIHSNRLIIYLLALHFLFIRTAFQWRPKHRPIHIIPAQSTLFSLNVHVDTNVLCFSTREAFFAKQKL